MALVKGTFNMLHIQDSEISQLSHDHQANDALTYIAQHPVLDLPFRSYFLLAVIGSMFGIGIWAAYLNGYSAFQEMALRH